MLVPLSALIIASIGLFIILNKISTNRAAEIRRLENKRRSLMRKYDFMQNQRRELRKEVEDKERQVATLRNSADGIKTVSASDLELGDTDENEKVSRYLIQEGKITLEQNEKVLRKMDVLQMDYVGTCLALGFIDIDTAKKTLKINKVTSKSPSLN